MNNRCALFVFFVFFDYSTIISVTGVDRGHGRAHMLWHISLVGFVAVVGTGAVLKTVSPNLLRRQRILPTPITRVYVPAKV